jgi:hypothetical protein
MRQLFSLKVEKIKSELLDTADCFLEGQSHKIDIFCEGWEKQIRVIRNFRFFRKGTVSRDRYFLWRWGWIRDLIYFTPLTYKHKYDKYGT